MVDTVVFEGTFMKKDDKRNMMVPQELRCYHLGNFYLSSIQQGIQAAHAQTNLLLKYCSPAATDGTSDRSAAKMVWDWAEHPTMICLNGGAHASLLAHKMFMENEDNPYPWSVFYEDEVSLAGMLTNVAIVVPEKIWTADWCLESENRFEIYSDEKQNHERVFGKLSDFEFELARFLKGFRLAG